MTERYEYVVIGLGALGSAAAYELARRGASVLGLEQFELGHVRGGSHDHSRIVRHSYHTPGYVRLTLAAYEDWANLEAASGERLLTPTGGLDLAPPDAAIPIADYTSSMAAVGVPFEELDRDAIESRWPQFALPDGTVGVYQQDAAVVAAARSVRVLHDQASANGAELRDNSPVTAVRDLGAAGIEVEAGGSTYRCRRLVVCADAWTNDVLSGLGHQLPLVSTLEQVTYFAPESPEEYAVGRLPLWIWQDDPSFYGLPCFGEPTVKAAQDCGGPVVSPDDRTFDPDLERLALLADFLGGTLPGSGPAQRSVRCLYTLAPDRDFVLGLLPGNDAVAVGLGCGHGFKFTPTFGRLLADLVTGVPADTSVEVDLAAFRPDRPALTEPDYVAHWLV